MLQEIYQNGFYAFMENLEDTKKREKEEISEK